MPIKFNDVSFSYLPSSPFETAALHNVNLEIKEGSFTAIIGHTGSGKSTLAQHINALLIPSQGTVIVDDFIIKNNAKVKHVKRLREKVGLVFQFPEYQLFEESCFKDIGFGPKNFQKTPEEIKTLVLNAAKLVGISDELLARSPFELSGGQRRRVAIAGILAMNPKILILDEPTAGLDPRGAKEMMNLFKELNKQGTTIILISHDMNYVLDYCSDVIVMKEGRVAAYNTPIEIFANKEVTSDLGLELPTVIAFAHELINKGLNLNLYNIFNVETLVAEIKRVKEAV